MSLANKAVSGAIWTIGGSLLSRGVGVVSSLVLTHFLVPEVIGEVALATTLVLTVHQLTVLGLGQYVIAHPEAPRQNVLHATWIYLLLGLVALSIPVLFATPIAEYYDANELVSFLGGMTIAIGLNRIAFMPERILIRDLQFKTVALTRSLSEFIYAGMSVALVIHWDMGGMGIVVANICQSGFRMVVYLWRAKFNSWLGIPSWSKETASELLRFGVPLSVGASAHFIARRWDKLLMADLFNTKTLGLYNMAYNLADIPASHVGEHIGDVLLPSFARISPEKRPSTLLRALALLSLIVFPLAIGLGVVSQSLTVSLLPEKWHGIAPLLFVLACLSIFHPIGWVMSSYLQAQKRTKTVMKLEVFKAVLLLGCLVLFGQWGILAACYGVGAAFATHALLSLLTVREVLPLWRMLRQFFGPLLACLLMSAAVLGIHTLMNPGWARLGLEVLTGASVYIAAALFFANTSSRELLRLLKRRRPAKT